MEDLETGVRHIVSDGAPAPLGCYSHAVATGGMLFCAAQLPLDPVTGELADDTADGQARQCLANLDAVCRTGGTTLMQAARLTFYFADRSVVASVDRACQAWFGTKPPARVPVHVVSLARGALVSMDAIVAAPN